MTTFAVTSDKLTSLPCLNLFRVGSKFRCMRSTPMEMQSTSENDFECFASRGVKSPAKAKLRHTGAKWPSGAESPRRCTCEGDLNQATFDSAASSIESALREPQSPCVNITAHHVT